MLFSIKIQSCLCRSISTVAVVALLAGTAVAAENIGLLPEKPVYDVKIDSAPPDRINAEYFKGYFYDTASILKSPAIWDGSDWLAAGLVVGATAGLYLADDDIQNFAQRNQTSGGDAASEIGNALGNPFYTLPSLGLFYLYGHLNDDPKARRTALLAGESVAISGAFTWTIKMATQRPRPDSGASASAWNGSSDPAFPSIHTQSAFSIAAVIAEEYGSNPYVPPIAYGLATLTGLSRIYSDKHWASDVFFGGAIGYLVGKTVVRYHTFSGGSPVKILPTVTQNGFGLMAEYRF